MSDYIKKVEAYIKPTLVCTRCKLELPIACFYERHGGKRSNDFRGSIWGKTNCTCITCARLVSRLERFTNVERHRESSREWGRLNWRNRYFYRAKRICGITEGEYNALLIKQGGKCAICGKIPHSRKSNRMAFCLDHNHETKRPRGLLCAGCNTAIGKLKDSVDILKAAIRYLEEYDVNIS